MTLATEHDQAAAVQRRAASLAEAADVLARHRDDEGVAQARAVAERVQQRLGHGTDHTVVAIAGQTGAGKSSLLNALVDQDVARVAVTRPTTSRPQAVVHDDGADALLDWLEVRDRHLVAADADSRSGLVLLDLPDMDSIELANRSEAMRLLGLADLLVVVTDPQKYADQALHEQVLAPLADHARVVRVVLNKADLLGDADVATCRDELTRLLRSDGLADVVPLVTSAATGRGLDQLWAVLDEAVVERRAAVDRADADLRRAARPLLPEGRATTAERELTKNATTGLAEAVGTDHVASVVAAQHRHDAVIATGWPLTRWVRRWRRAPLRDVPALGRRVVATDAVRATLRDVGEQAGAGLVAPWDRIVRDVARGHEAAVLEGLDHVTTRGVEGLRRAPRWWSMAAGLQGLLLVTAVVGGAWLAALLLGSSLLLVDVEALTPRWRGVPLPTLLLAGGLVVGWLLALLARALASLGARRRRRRAAAALRTQVAGLAEEQVVAPLLAAREEHRRVGELLDTVLG